MSGIPQLQNENPYATVQKLASISNIQLGGWDIVSAHRLPEKKNATGTFTDYPLIIKFFNRDKKDEFMRKIKEKKPSAELFNGSRNVKIFLNHQLTARQRDFFNKARELRNEKYGFRFVWFQNGRILVRKQHDSRIIRINNLQDIDRIKNQQPGTPS